MTGLDRLLAQRSAVTQWASQPAVRRALFVAGAVAFVAMAIVSWRALPDPPDDIRWMPIALVVIVLAPLTIALSGAEFLWTARVAGRTVSPLDAFQVAIASSAANLLPLPGSFLVRAAALRGAGATPGAAVMAPLGVGLAWLGLGGIIAGLWLSVEDPTWFGVVLLASGVALALVSVVLLRRGSSDVATADIMGIWVIEAAMTFVSALRYLLVLDAIGTDVTFGQSLALALSSIVATAVGIVPAGLGVREALAAAFAPLVDLPAAVGVVGAVINRILGLVALAALSVIVMVVAPRTRTEPT